MRARVPLSVLWATALGLAGIAGHAAVVTQSNTDSFLTGLSTGAAGPMSDPVSPDGGFGIVPSPGTVVFSDDFNYTTAAAAKAAGWLFLTPNAEEIPELADNPDEFLFSGDTSTTGGSAPAAGVFRMRASRPHDLTATSQASTRQPVLAMYSTPVTGDFIAETRLKIQYERFPTVTRHQGIFVTHPSGLLNGKAEGVELKDAATYVAWGPSKDDFLNMLARLYDSGPNLINFQTQHFPGTDYTVRLVKRGVWYYGYIRTGDTGPWVLQNWFAAPSLAATVDAPVIVGLFGKSWGAVAENRPRYGDTDYDYFRLNRVGDTSGTFTNVMDGGSAGNWQTFSYSTHSMPGTKYQLRAGNTAAGGTLTDAGAFAGPDGTAGTWYEDDAAQVIPNAKGKRYLEYKFNLDGSSPNLPAYVDLTRAIFEPKGVEATFVSTKSEWGADGGGLAVQPGDGDLSLARTQVYLDDFNTNETSGIGGDNPDGSLAFNPSTNGWMFYSGNARVDPNVVGRFSMTARPGYYRMTVGYPQDLKEGGDDLGGVTLLREAPAAADFEIETEVELPVQMSRQAGIVIWQDQDNFVGMTVARRNETTFEVGLLEQTVLNNGAVNLATLNYGSGHMQLRVTKVGNIVTYSVRDAASQSPSWRVVGVRNIAATWEFFTPVQVGLLGKSSGLANREPVDYDFNYFKISTLAATGTKDISFTLPAGSRGDIVKLLGDAVGGANAKAQVNTGAGFVGPDGTAASFFNVNEPKLPATIASPATVRVTLDSATNSGIPYLHALGLQYVTGDTVVARDTNAADFSAGAVKDNVDLTTTPGTARNAGVFSFGNWVKDDLNFTSQDLSGTGWTWDTTYTNNAAAPGEKSTYDVLARPGYVRTIIGPKEDIGTGAHFHTFFRRADTLSGDWEIETLIDTTIAGRDTSRITGIGVQQDNNNLILMGLLNTGDLAQRSYNGGGAIIRDGAAPAGTFTASAYYLRIQKVGQTFTSWAKAAVDFNNQPTDPNTDPNVDTEWVRVAKRTFNGITTPQVGLMAMSVNAPNPQWPVDYDYFRVRPLNAEGVLVSRVLDLGTAGNTPLLTAEGTSLGNATLQFRAADTQAALTSLPWVGPDGTSGTTYALGNAGTLLNGLTKRYVQYRLVLPVGASVNEVTLISAAAGALPAGDALTALKIAGGLLAASGADKDRLDVVGGTSAGKVDLADAVQLLRTANGL